MEPQPLESAVTTPETLCVTQETITTSVSTKSRKKKQKLQSIDVLRLSPASASMIEDQSLNEYAVT